jgi:hypothetical protein
MSLLTAQGRWKSNSQFCLSQDELSPRTQTLLQISTEGGSSPIKKAIAISFVSFAKQVPGLVQKHTG